MMMIIRSTAVIELPDDPGDVAALLLVEKCRQIAVNVIRMDKLGHARCVLQRDFLQGDASVGKERYFGEKPSHAGNLLSRFAASLYTALYCKAQLCCALQAAQQPPKPLCGFGRGRITERLAALCAARRQRRRIANRYYDLH